MRYLGFTLSLSAAVFFLVQFWFDNGVTDAMLGDAMRGFSDSLERNLQQQQADHSFSEDQLAVLREENAAVTASFMSVYRLLFDYYSVLFVASIPLAALGHRLFYPRNTFNIPESMVASFYIYSHATLLALLLAPIGLLFSNSAVEFLNSLVAAYAICSIYTVFAVHATYGHRWWEFFVHLLLWGLCIVVLFNIVFGLGFLGGIVFRRGDALQYISDSPLRFVGLVATTIGGLLWGYLLYRFRSAPQGTSNRRLWAVAIVVLPLLLIAVRLMAFH